MAWQGHCDPPPPLDRDLVVRLLRDIDVRDAHLSVSRFTYNERLVLGDLLRDAGIG